MQHNYIKEQLQTKSVKITHVRPDDQDAEIFTKPLGCIKFSKNRQRIGVEKIDGVNVDLMDRGET